MDNSITCPKCNEQIAIDIINMTEKIECPFCGSSFEVENFEEVRALQNQLNNLFK